MCIGKCLKLHHLHLLLAVILYKSDILSKVSGPCSTNNDNCTCFNESSGLDHDDMCGCLPGFEIVTTEEGNTLCQGIKSNYVVLCFAGQISILAGGINM